jgi:hypothetical protein
MVEQRHSVQWKAGLVLGGCDIAGSISGSLLSPYISGVHLLLLFVYVFGGDKPRGLGPAEPHMGACGKFSLFGRPMRKKASASNETVDLAEDYTRSPPPLLAQRR